MEIVEQTSIVLNLKSIAIQSQNKTKEAEQICWTFIQQANKHS